MIAEAHLILGLVKAAVTGDSLTLALPFEPRTWHDVEDTIGALAEFGGISAALNLNGLDVAGIELRAHGARDVGIRHRYSVDEPRHLVSPPDVQLVVDDVGARNELGHHLDA